MKIKTSELTGAALDWAVATQCEGRDYVQGEVAYAPNGKLYQRGSFAIEGPDYSTDWSQGGPIIERERISIDWAARMVWDARLYAPDEEPWQMLGPTPLIAAMRCYVASKLGDEVEVPDELA